MTSILGGGPQSAARKRPAKKTAKKTPAAKKPGGNKPTPTPTAPAAPAAPHTAADSTTVVTNSGLTQAGQVSLLQQAGFIVTTTKPAGTGWVSPAPGIYILNKPGSKLNDGTHGYGEAAYGLMASITDPNLNAQSLSRQLGGAGITWTPGDTTGTTGTTGTATDGQDRGHHPRVLQQQPTGTGVPGAPGVPGGFTPTAYTGGAGAVDPNQPFGQGFGNDYGLTDLLGTDPNFAFGSGSTAPPAAGTGTGTTATGSPVTGSTGSTGTSGSTQGYGPGTFFQPHVPTPTPTPAASGQTGPLTAQQQNELTGYLQGVLPRPGWLGNLGATRQANIDEDARQIAQLPPGQRPAAAAGAAGTFAAKVAADHPGTAGGAGGGTAGGTGGGTGAGSGDAADANSTENQNALASLTTTLNTYGLGDLAPWAWQEIVAGKSEQQVMLDLMQTPQFKARFPSIEARQKAGLPPISPGEIVTYENQATQVMRAAGLPSGFWDSPADFTHLLSADVSINELTQRVNLASQAAYQVPADVRATLARDYGVGPGQLAAFFLDEKTALPLIQRDFTAAQVGGAAYRTGYGSTKAEDERLTDLGVSSDQAQQGFTQLVGQRQLFSSLPGENTTGISRDDQLAATFAGNGLAQEKVVRRAQRRVADFAGGGGFSSGAGGFSGIGQAQGA